MNNKILKKTKIPDQPGVYFFKKGKEILYIGKATSLRDRVKSYFGKDLFNTRGPVLVDMLSQASKIDWQTTDSVLEALILEADLIKKNQPKYNTKEKSDKSFNYVVITKPTRLNSRSGGEKLPKVIIVRGKALQEEQKNFGPFTNGSQLRDALKIIRKIFPFLDDKSKNSLEFYKQINLVPDLEDRKMYLQNIKNIKLFFEGKKKRIISNLRKEMKEYAKNKEFELAGEIKRQLFALQHINDIALLKTENLKAKNEKVFRIEAYDIAHMAGKNMVGVMTVIENNNVVKSEYKKFKIRSQDNSNDTGALSEVLYRRFLHPEWIFPDLIVVDGSISQINATRKALKDVGVDIPVVSVVKDERHKPKAIKGQEKLIRENKSAILLANSEAHRFAIAYHKNMRAKSFLKI